MSNLALRNRVHDTPDGSADPPMPRLKVVEAAPNQRATRRHIAFHYLSLAAAAMSAVALFAWLAPSEGQRVAAIAALVAAASLFLLAASPLAHRPWQRLTGTLIAALQFLLALESQWEPGLVYWSLLCFSGGCLYMLQVSREHNWQSPGVFWFCFVLGAGMIAVNVLS